MEFNRILKNFEKNTDYWTYSNKEYAKYHESHPYKKFPNPNIFKANGKNKTKHIILTTDCFKELIMMLNTPRAPAIRKHYIQIEKLMFAYMRYQCVALNLNFEAATSYSLTVSATDTGFPEGTANALLASAAISITVMDVNEAPTTEGTAA